jgi:hypothetical protein
LGLAARVIPLVRRHLLILVPTLASVESEVRVAVGAEASLNGNVRGTISFARGLVDGHGFSGIFSK